MGIFACLLLCSPVQLAAQQDPLNKAFDLERRGNYAAAAEIYRSILAKRPGEVTALLGLERTLVPLNRLPEITPVVEAGLLANPTAPAIYGLAVRAWAAADQPDSLRGVVERWARLVPQDETPYREWGAAALARRDRQTAHKAYSLGRERIGRADALAAEMAQLAILEEDYSTAVREWVQAVQRLPGYRATALAALTGVPQPRRGDVLHLLDQGDSSEARRLGIDLRARWGDPSGAYKLLAASLPAAPSLAIDALRQFIDQVRGQSSRDARAAQGQALEALADRLAPPQRPAVRLDAARAYADAGDRESARRMLTGLAGDTGNPPEVAVGAAATLIGLLVDEGKVDEAAQRLEQFHGRLPGDDYRRLRRSLAIGWIRAGRFDRAQALLASDSTVESLALLGRIALYRGNLQAARQALQAAGPYTGTRQEATDRAALLALLQQIEVDSFPALGEAFARLDRGDTAAAVSTLDQLSAGLPAQGGAELRLLAGRLQAAQGHRSEAERLFRGAISPGAPATAAAANLELGRLLLSLGRKEEAVKILEQLILDYPQSALVPQARRLLDIARGGVPRT